MGAGTSRRAAATTLTVTLVVLAAVAALVTTVVTRADQDDRPAAADRGPARTLAHLTVTEAVASLSVLRDWDAARAAAWRSGDVGALRELYLPSSRAGERDAAMLRRWSGRGLVVRGMAMQVLAVELLARTDRRIVLLVTDRLARAVAVADGGSPDRWQLPRDAPSTRRLTFRHTGDGWQVAAVVGKSVRRTGNHPGPPLRQ